MRHSKVIGIDLAKTIFQLHVATAHGKPMMKKRVSRAKLLETLANLPPALIGIEACIGAHYWARQFQTLGHEVKIMSPHRVNPYLNSNKNDSNDAKGIAEAVTRPTMKFVPIKTIEQQDMLLLHKARELSVKHRTAQSNHLRGLLAEYGIVFPKGLVAMRRCAEILEQEGEKLTELARSIFQQIYQQFTVFDEQVKGYDRQIEKQAKADARCRALMAIEGVGPKIATAAVAAIGDPNVFRRGREVSAWLGLVPRQWSSGNKLRLLGITKHGNRYLRTLLIHGARSVVRVCEKKTDRRSRWVADKKARCGENKAAVALANKNARIIWALLSSGECYRAPSQACL